MPKTCCSCHDDEDEKHLSGDTCMCGCGYLNGWVAIVGVQLLAMIGMFFSIAALCDCSFMELNERLFFPDDMDGDRGSKGGSNLPIEVTQTQYVGFLTWKKLDGSCYWYNSGSNPEEQIQTFIDILGKDWEMSRICGGLSSSLSFLFFCYLLSFTCSSQTRGVRYFNTVFLCVVLTALQGLTFVTFDSNNDFCEEYICTFSRSAGFSVVSMGCFFLSGLCFCCTQDYPGPRWKKKTSSFSSSSPLKARQQQIAPDSRVVLAPGVTTKSKVATAMGDESKNEEVGYRNFGGNPNDGLRTNDESDNISSGPPAYYTAGADRNDGSDGSGGGSGNHENVTRSINEFSNKSFEEIEEEEEEEEVIEEKYEEGSVATGGTSIADNKNQQINDDDFNALIGLTAGDSRDAHADGSKTVTKTTEEIAEDGYQREGEIKIDDGFVAHPVLVAGDDCEVITEVTEDEIKVVETIRHADGSQTVTETHEEISDEKV